MMSLEDGERWHDAPVGHMVKGPCPRCLRDGKRLNTCRHQLPQGLGYVVASFDLAKGTITEIA